MNKVILNEYKSCLGTIEIEIECKSKEYIVDIIAWGEWYREKIKTIKEIEEILEGYGIAQSKINEIKGQVKSHP